MAELVNHDRIVSVIAPNHDDAPPGRLDRLHRLGRTGSVLPVLPVHEPDLSWENVPNPDGRTGRRRVLPVFPL